MIMNENELVERLESILSANERKLDDLLKARNERKTVSETKVETEKHDVSDADIRKVIDKLEI